MSEDLDGAGVAWPAPESGEAVSAGLAARAGALAAGPALEGREPLAGKDVPSTALGTGGGAGIELATDRLDGGLHSSPCWSGVVGVAGSGDGTGVEARLVATAEVPAAAAARGTGGAGLCDGMAEAAGLAAGDVCCAVGLLD